MTAAERPASPAALKARLRARARAARRGVANRAEAGAALVERFCESPWRSPAPGTAVAGYWPVHGEIDCRPLLRHLRDMGARIVLPAVETRAAPLAFRCWDGGVPPARDLVNMAVPPADAARARPELLLVPLLLVDATGHRLGYGGGYYDRTLRELRQTGSVTALGLAFDIQLTGRLPSAADDMTLDGVITQSGWRRFGEGGAAPS